MDDMSEFLKVAEQAANMSREILMDHRNKNLQTNFNFETKADFSPVTEIDMQVERKLREFIQVNFPEHGILGEEYGESNIDEEYVWVLDPIDGTRAFITGIPVYGTLISLCRFGEPIIGIIDMPAIDERWIGVKGRRTTLNDVEIYSSSCTDLSEAILSTSNPEPILAEHLQGYHQLIQTTKWRVYGGSCYSYGSLATGKIDISIDSGDVEPIDYCALVPVIEGAGGIITDWEGLPLNINSGNAIIAAGNEKLHEQVMKIVSKK